VDSPFSLRRRGRGCRWRLDAREIVQSANSKTVGATNAIQKGPEIDMPHVNIFS
jgi:hypothetical protein